MKNAMPSASVPPHCDCWNEMSRPPAVVTGLLKTAKPVRPTTAGVRRNTPFPAVSMAGFWQPGIGVWLVSLLAVRHATLPPAPPDAHAPGFDTLLPVKDSTVSVSLAATPVLRANAAAIAASTTTVRRLLDARMAPPRVLGRITVVPAERDGAESHPRV